MKSHRISTPVLSIVGVGIMLSSLTSRADTVVDYIYTGTASFTDNNGPFGAPSSSLSGGDFTATFQFDLNTGVHINTGGQEEVYGPTTGPYEPGDPMGGSPLVSASLTINGKSVAIYGNGYSFANAIADGYFQASAMGSQNSMQTSMLMTTELAGTTVFPILGLNSLGSYFSQGYIFEPNYLIDTNGTFTISSANSISSGTLFASNLTIADMSPIPLPASAWLMLSGLGALGAFVQRRRKVALAGDEIQEQANE
jgi:hypothetical protein